MSDIGIQKVCPDAGGNPRRRCLHRVPRQMGVAGRGFNLAMAKQFSDHRQALTERQRPARKGMPQIMKPHVIQPGARPHLMPKSVDTR